MYSCYILDHLLPFKIIWIIYFIPVCPKSVNVDGPSEANLVNSYAMLTCSVEKTRPAGKNFYWIRDGSMDKLVGHIENYSLPQEVYRQVHTYAHLLKSGDNGRNIRCVFEMDTGSTLIQQYQLIVDCKFWPEGFYLWQILIMYRWQMAEPLGWVVRGGHTLP